jgi:hypothetical protein
VFGAVLVSLVATLAPTVPAGAAVGQNHPTLDQLTNDLQLSLLQSHVPDVTSTKPTLAWAPKTQYGHIPPLCYPTDPHDGVFMNAYTGCAFGDRKAKRTILLMGDDEALQWLPSFNALGVDLRWRVVFVAKARCSPWSYGTNLEGHSCRRFVAGEVALVNQLRPKVVVPVGEKVRWRGNLHASVVYLRREIARTLAALAPSRARVLMLQPIPEFNHGFTRWTPQTCMRQFASRIAPCERRIYKDATTSTAAIAIPQEGAAENVAVVPTLDLFCSAPKCALFVTTTTGTWLVYRDARHMNRVYGYLIHLALEQLVRPLL